MISVNKIYYYRYSALQINETDFDPQGEQPGLVKYLRSGV